MKEWNETIYYSQCWEDPDVLLEALNIQKDDTVLSVTSGGCNTLAIALQKPRYVIALDLNLAQSNLLELKIAAIKSLNYDEFLEFIGVIESKNRIKYFQKIKENISEKTYKWWENRQSSIKRGIIHAGKFEKFLIIFRNLVLPFIHSRNTIDTLLSLKTLSEQKEFYDKKWNNWRWKVLFRLFFNKFIMSGLGRNPILFTYNGVTDIGSHYFQRTKSALTEIPIKNNYFLEYILRGTYKTQENMPPYLKRENFDLLKDQVGNITIITDDIKDFLLKSFPNQISKFNLSNIFEAQSIENTNFIFTEILKVSLNKGRLVYWNNLVKREPPLLLKQAIIQEKELEIELKNKDRVFFYNDFHINITNK